VSERPSKKSSEDVKAYEMGQGLAALLINAFNGYSELRFVPILKRYLDIYREQLQQAIKSKNMPPCHSAKARSEAFGTKLAGLKTRNVRRDVGGTGG